MIAMTKQINVIPVEKSNDFVGIKFENNSVNLFVPQVFRQDENRKQDLLLFLKSLSIAKSSEKEPVKTGEKVNNEVWPIDSYLWIIHDYLENGFYYNREKIYSKSNSGKIEWKKTLKQIPIYSDGNIIYDKLITSKMTASNDIVAQTYKLCLKQSLERIGWIFNYNFYVEIQQLFSVNEMINSIRKELNQTFDDIKKLRYNHLLKILNNSDGNNLISNAYSYGIENYYYVFETMIDKLFDGLKENEKKKYNPNGYWQLNNQKAKKASELRPDTILKRNGATYILDAKMYQYGVTHDVKDLPETQSIQKQITYGDHAYHNHKLHDTKVRNAFILPYNKKLEIFVEDPNTLKYNDGNLAYFGQAYTDWRDGDQQKDYEKVYAFGIDFNYLLRNYKTIDTDIINNLYTVIEERIKEQIDEGADN